MRTSPKRPPGHVNDWPLDDRNAFVALVTETYARMARGEGEVGAAHEAARTVGLDGAESHWMCDEMLSGVFGVFYVRSGDHYADAAGVVRFATLADLEQLGPVAVAWARELAEAGTEH